MTTSNQTSVFTLHESDVRGYCRRIDTVFASAKGAIMRDTDGREYIDFLAACGALSYGHNDEDMTAALISHLSRNGMSACLDLHSDVKAAFLTRFQELILGPRGLDYRVQFTGPTGTNAVEAALKLARKVTGRTNVIAFTNGFHGVSLGSLAATGNRYNRMGMVLPGVTRMPFAGYLGPDCDTAAYLDKILDDPSGGVEPPAAILLETVQGEGGLNSAPATWLQKIEAIARKHGSLLIIDDIQAGCGRTGTFFSFENMGITPDLVTLSKSISGYGLPMALVLIQPEFDQWNPAEHNGTFRGNSHAFVTARVTLEKFWHDSTLSSALETKAEFVQHRLRRIGQLIPESRLKGRGMMQGIDVGSGPTAAAICALCFRQGLICETSGPRDEVIKIMPPLTIPTDLLSQGFDILEAAVREHLSQHRSATPSTALIPKSKKTTNSERHDDPTTHHHRSLHPETISIHPHLHRSRQHHPLAAGRAAASAF